MEDIGLILKKINTSNSGTIINKDDEVSKSKMGRYKTGTLDVRVYKLKSSTLMMNARGKGSLMMLAKLINCIRQGGQHWWNRNKGTQRRKCKMVESAMLEKDIRILSSRRSNSSSRFRIQIIKILQLMPTTNLLPGLKILKNIVRRKKVTEWFKARVGWLIEKRLIKKLETYITLSRGKQEEATIFSSPRTGEKEPSAMDIGGWVEERDRVKNKDGYLSCGWTRVEKLGLTMGSSWSISRWRSQKRRGMRLK